MKKNIKNIFAITIVLTLALTSCKKKETTPEPTPEPAPANGSVYLHLHTNADTNEVDTYNQVYVMTGGRKISVSIAQLYISSIQLVKSDGTTFDIASNIAKTMQVEQYSLGSVPAGNYKSIRFNVGLSASTNSSTPSVSDSTLNKANMWFGTTAQPLGYVFMNFQGKIDTTTAGNGTVLQMQPFTYRIGTNARLKSVSMSDQNYTVVSNQAQYIHLTIDYNKLFSGVTLHTASNLSVATTIDNAGALSTQITNNIPLMFSYEY